MKFKEKLNKLLEKTIYNELFIIESLFLLGAVIIIITNFSISIRFGLYFLGLILIALSVFLYKFRREKR